MEINGIGNQSSIQSLRINETDNLNQNEKVAGGGQQQERVQQQTDRLELSSQNRVTDQETIETDARAREVQEDLTRAITENSNTSVLTQSGNLSAERVANLL